MTDKQAYEAAVVALREARAFVDKPRCINCEHYQSAGKSATCVLYGQAIPDEYLWTPNECTGHEISIPF
jgi:hypothetical protein